MSPTRKQIEDLDTLRAFVHPLRIRLLGALRLHGAATASELARRLGESSGATSYHLRQLERFGFVADDDRQPSRRERRWRAVHELTSWETSSFIDDEVGRGAVQDLQQMQLRLLVESLQKWYTQQHRWGRDWVDAAEHSDRAVRVTADELAAMSAEVGSVIERYRQPHAREENETAQTVVVHLVTVPVPEPDS